MMKAISWELQGVSCFHRGYVGDPSDLHIGKSNVIHVQPLSIITNSTTVN